VVLLESRGQLIACLAICSNSKRRFQILSEALQILNASKSIWILAIKIWAMLLVAMQSGTSPFEKIRDGQLMS
jgi:hypothetical protein